MLLLPSQIWNSQFTLFCPFSSEVVFLMLKYSLIGCSWVCSWDPICLSMKQPKSRRTFKCNTEVNEKEIPESWSLTLHRCASKAKIDFCFVIIIMHLYPEAKMKTPANADKFSPFTFAGTGRKVCPKLIIQPLWQTSSLHTTYNNRRTWARTRTPVTELQTNRYLTSLFNETSYLKLTHWCMLKIMFCCFCYRCLGWQPQICGLAAKVVAFLCSFFYCLSSLFLFLHHLILEI